MFARVVVPTEKLEWVSFAWNTHFRLKEITQYRIIRSLPWCRSEQIISSQLWEFWINRQVLFLLISLCPPVEKSFSLRYIYWLITILLRFFYLRELQENLIRSHAAGNRVLKNYCSREYKDTRALIGRELPTLRGWVFQDHGLTRFAVILVSWTRHFPLTVPFLYPVHTTEPVVYDVCFPQP